jgi:hypothetical protein
MLNNSVIAGSKIPQAIAAKSSALFQQGFCWRTRKNRKIPVIGNNSVNIFLHKETNFGNRLSTPRFLLGKEL